MCHRHPGRVTFPRILAWNFVKNNECNFLIFFFPIICVRLRVYTVNEPPTLAYNFCLVFFFFWWVFRNFLLGWLSSAHFQFVFFFFIICLHKSTFFVAEHAFFFFCQQSNENKKQTNKTISIKKFQFFFLSRMLLKLKLNQENWSVSLLKPKINLFTRKLFSIILCVIVVYNPGKVKFFMNFLL